MITKIGLDTQEQEEEDRIEHPYMVLGGGALGGVASQQMLGKRYINQHRYDAFLRQNPETAKNYFKDINAHEQQVIDRVNAKYRHNYLSGVDEKTNRRIDRVRATAERMRQNKWNNAVRSRMRGMWFPGAIAGLVGGTVAGNIMDNIRN